MNSPFPLGEFRPTGDGAVSEKVRPIQLSKRPILGHIIKAQADRAARRTHPSRPQETPK